jgi:hypothetical protein
MGNRAAAHARDYCCLIVGAGAGLLNLKTFLGIPLIDAGEAFARLASDRRSKG